MPNELLSDTIPFHALPEALAFLREPETVPMNLGGKLVMTRNPHYWVSPVAMDRAVRLWAEKAEMQRRVKIVRRKECK